MRRFRCLLACVLPVLLAGCVSSTPEARIARNRAMFDGFPSEVQQKVRAGRVEIGFTPDMVQLALGEPDRRFIRQTAAGKDEVWVYLDDGPRFGLGLGFASYRRHSATAVGVDAATGGRNEEEKLRVEFREGRVHVIDYVRR